MTPTDADIQWVRERIDPDEWAIFIKLGYDSTAREAVDAAATAALTPHDDKRDALADLLEIIDAQHAFNAEAAEGHSRSGPRYQEMIARLRGATEEDETPSGAGDFVQVPVRYFPDTTWDEYARNPPP